MSVLVPICNVERYLRQCLDSLIAQTQKDLQIICIDDGSTDSSPSILREYQMKDPRIEVITKPNSGYGDSMNKGLDLARGEYVGIVESDDFADPSMFEDMLRLARAYDVDVVKGNYYSHITGRAPQNDPVVELLGFCTCGKVYRPCDKQEVFLIQPAIWSGLYRRQFLLDNDIRFLPTPGASYQDTSFNFKVFAAAKRAYLTKNAYLHYRIDNANSSVKSSAKVFCICDEYKEMWSFLKSRPDLEPLLNKRLPQMQFGSYTWNLERLSSHLQHSFYEQFVKEFQTIKDEGLLSPTHSDDIAWAKLHGMLDDPDGYFRKTYGPVEVNTTYLVSFQKGAIDAQAEDRLRKALDGLGEKCKVLYDFGKDHAAQPVLEAIAWADKRVSSVSDLFLHVPCKALDIDRLRGERIVTLSVADAANSDWLEFLESVADAEGTSEDATARVRTLASSSVAAVYQRSFLAELGVPLILPMLSSSFYAEMASPTSGDATGASAASETVFATHAAFGDMAEPCLRGDYQNAAKMFRSLYEARSANDEAPNNLHRHITPLWLRIRDIYAALPYGERLAVGTRRSSSEFGASVREDGIVEENVDLTLIIPLYNAVEHLEECIKSVQSQTIANMQIICVDDGSTDGSLALLEKLAEEDPRIMVISQLNGGAGSARNRAIDYAKGEYLAFLDSDDYYPDENSLSSLLNAARANDAKMCGGSFTTVWEDGTIEDVFGGEAIAYTATEEGFRPFTYDQFDYGWIRFIYHRSLFQSGELRFPELTWYEDPVFLTTAVGMTGGYYLVPRPTYRYRVGHKETAWTPLRTSDMLQGIACNMKFAAENDLNCLYSTLVKRIENDYFCPIMNNMHDEGVRAKIIEIQAGLDCSRINSARESGSTYHTLRPLAETKHLLEEVPVYTEDVAIVRLARRLGQTTFYRKLQMMLIRLRSLRNK